MKNNKKAKKERKIKLPYPYDINDPDQLFDLIIYRTWTLGNFDGNIPVDESRQVFRKIKELLKN